MRPGSVISIAGVLGVNLYALIGWLFLDWDLVVLFALYMIETLVASIINIPKMRRAQGPSMENESRITCRGREVPVGKEMPFYIMLVVLMLFVEVTLGLGFCQMAADRVAADLGLAPMHFTDRLLAHSWELAAGFVICLVTEIVSHFRTFLGQGEYLRISPRGQFDKGAGRLLGIAGVYVSVFGLCMVTHNVKILVGLAVLIKIGLELKAQVKRDAALGVPVDSSGAEGE